MRKHAIIPAVLTWLVLALPVLARDHGALNGTWTLAPEKCDFAGQPAIEAGTVTIDEREGNISVARSFVYKGTSGQTFFYRDMTDSQNNATIHDGKDVKSKTRWDHGVLKVVTTQNGATTMESYTLAGDGTLRANVARPGQTPVTLVFERK